MALPRDWQDFLIQHPWAPRRVLRAKYGIKNHDVDNWLRGNPNARQILDPDRWRLTRDKPAPRIREIMEKAWKYYIEEELGINVGGTYRSAAAHLHRDSHAALSVLG